MRGSAHRCPGRPLLVLALIVALVAGAIGPAGASADTGTQGPSFSGTSSPTGTKRGESVLWWNDGHWWANMWDTASQDFHIFRLNTSTQTWQDTGVAVDTRANTHADVLWNGTKLYVASNRFVNDGQPAVSGTPSHLFRYSYNPSTDTYTKDAGYPVLINNYRTETLVVDRDSTGKLWATWQQGNKIMINRTTGSDNTWGTPFELPVGNNVTVDDTSSLVRFGGNKIGVMWSNQDPAIDGFYFAIHTDGQPDTTWTGGQRIPTSESSDDHMNLKALEADGSGRVFAAVKTEETAASQPLIMLLSYDGTWSSDTFGVVSDCHNRPTVLIDEQASLLRMIATGPHPTIGGCNSTGGAIYMKSTPLNNPNFAPGRGTPIIVDDDSAAVHNASSTKQNLNAATGIAVLAVNSSTQRYWHHHAGGGPVAPTAAFTGTPTSGTAPLAVQFTDASTGGPTSWSWNFGDGTPTSSAQNPNHTYAAAGTYTVSLTATNATGGNTTTQTNYITVNPPGPTAPTAAFTGTPTSGTAPLAVQFTDASTGGPTSWSWNFGDGTPTSSAQNPNHTYAAAGTYTVSLTASNAGGSNTSTRTGYIAVGAPSGGTTISVPAAIDAHVSEAQPSSNFGTATSLEVDAGTGVNKYAYLRFDVPAISGTITSAKIRAFVTNSTGNGPKVFATGSGWTEGGLTWANRPAPVGSHSDDKASVPSGAFVEYNVAPIVTAGGSHNFVFVPDSTDGLTVNSGENSSNPPALVITTTGGTPDVTPPETQIDSGPAGTVATSSATFTFSASEAGSTFACSLDGAAFAPCASPATYTGLANATHNFEVRATDGAGNTDLTPASRSWTVAVPPTSTITVPAAADSYVSEAQSGTNFGTGTILQSDQGTGVNKHALLRFDVSGVTGSVTGAKVRMFVTNSTTNGPKIFATSTGWTETGVTWANRPSATGVHSDDKTNVPSGAFVEYDVTPLVTGNGTFAFILVPESTDGLDVHSRENTNPPTLQVTFG